MVLHRPQRASALTVTASSSTTRIAGNAAKLTTYCTPKAKTDASDILLARLDKFSASFTALARIVQFDGALQLGYGFRADHRWLNAAGRSERAATAVGDGGLDDERARALLPVDSVAFSGRKCEKVSCGPCTSVLDPGTT